MLINILSLKSFVGSLNRFAQNIHWVVAEEILMYSEDLSDIDQLPVIIIKIQMCSTAAATDESQHTSL